MTRRYKLPGGGYTTDVDEYVAAWRRIADAVTDRTGWRLIGFDPGLLFSTGRYSSLSLGHHEACAIAYGRQRGADAEMTEARALAAALARTAEGDDS